MNLVLKLSGMILNFVCSPVLCKGKILITENYIGQ